MAKVISLREYCSIQRWGDVLQTQHCTLCGAGRHNRRTCCLNTPGAAPLADESFQLDGDDDENHGLLDEVAEEAAMAD
jgi:hypothetical protein